LNGIAPRSYQESAAGAVLQKGNTLVVMPTALGKTVVALLVIKELLERRENSGKKALFLAPTKPLAVQQAKRIEEATGFSTVVVTGEISPEKRALVWSSPENKVMVATPQTVENDLEKGFVKLPDYCVIVFDEAHRTVKEYAYARIAKQVPSGVLLLGLTASPSSDSEKVREVCENLGIRHVEVRTDFDEEVKKYAHEVKTRWEYVELPPEFGEVKAFFKAMLLEVQRKLNEAGLVRKGFVSKKELLQLRLKIRQGDSRFFFAMTMQARAVNLMHCIELLEAQGVNSLEVFLKGVSDRKEKSKAISALLRDSRFKKAIELVSSLKERKIEHPKFERLLQIVSGAVQEGKSAIVFVHYRETARQVEGLFAGNGISCKQLVGKSNGGMTQKKQAQTVQEFREKQFPVLLATSIGEEGLDIPAVDLVVFFEAVPSEIRLIQRRGRAGRAKVGEAIILVAKGTSDEAFFWTALKKEKKMHKNLRELKEEMQEGEKNNEFDGHNPSSFREQNKEVRDETPGQKTLGEY
jgi:Fanconi anemia group M protein